MGNESLKKMQVLMVPASYEYVVSKQWHAGIDSAASYERAGKQCIRHAGSTNKHNMNEHARIMRHAGIDSTNQHHTNKRATSA